MTTKQISAHRTIGPEPGTWRAPYRMKENASEGGSGPCGESQRHAGAVLGGKQWAGCWVVGRGGKGGEGAGLRSWAGLAAGRWRWVLLVDPLPQREMKGRVVQGRGGVVVSEAWKLLSITLLVPVGAPSTVPLSGLSQWEALPPAGRTGWAPRAEMPLLKVGWGHGRVGTLEGLGLSRSPTVGSDSRG